MKKIPIIPALSAVLGSACILYYIICGMRYTFAMSGLWIWLCFGLILWFGVLWKIIAEPRIIGGAHGRLYHGAKAAVLSAFCLFMAVFFLFEGLLIAKWAEGSRHREDTPDAVMLLGAGVVGDRPGDALAERISTAYEYIAEHPGITVIACGGLGDGDTASEADCIKNELIKLGVPADSIITETESASTVENFIYAAKLLPEGAGSVAVVTSGFHQLRACLTGMTALADAGANDVELIPVSADYSHILLPYSMIREFAAFTSDFAKGNVRLP